MPPQLPAWLVMAGAIVALRVVFNLQILPVDLRIMGVPLVSLLGYQLFVRRAEKREPHELGGGALGIGQFGIGMLLALCRPALVIGAWLGLGAVALRLEDWRSFALAVLLLSAGSAFVEELLFRGLLLRYLELKLGSYAAIVLSAILFAAPHLMLRPSWGAIRFAELALSGVALGSAYVLTRRLWMSIGLHVGHNIAVLLLFSNPLTNPVTTWQPSGDPFWVDGVGVELLWLISHALVAALLLAIIILRRRAVGPSAAWPAQIAAAAGATAGGRRNACTR